MIQGPMIQSSRRFHYYAIIPHPTELKVLMLAGEGGWSLPHLVPVEHHFGAVGHINQAIQEMLGIEVSVLRCVYYSHSIDSRIVEAIYEVENYDPVSAWDDIKGQDSSWVGSNTLGGLNFAVNEQRKVLEDWFEEARISSTPALRRPWARPGWFKTACAWIETRLEGFGLKIIAPIEQLRAWGISSILKAKTSERVVYFRAVPEISAHEPLLMKTLSDLYPKKIPNVLAIDVAERWILMDEIGGTPLYLNFDMERWEEALCSYAQMQVELSGCIQTLLDIGCPDRRLESLPARIDRLLEDGAAMQIGMPNGLTKAEFAALHSIAPRLKSLSAQMASFNIPHSLEHGDFHPYNINVTDEGCVYFDWSESSISHPFFSLAAFEYYIEYLLPDMRDVRRRVRDAYLEPWTIYEPMGRLIKAFELSRPLAALHSALTFHRLLTSLEERSRWEMEVEAALPFALKMLLKNMRYKT
jgi:hypothetical protein